MDNYDNYITGLYNEDSPMNQEELDLEPEEILSLKEAYDTGYEHLFDERLEDLKRDLNELNQFIEDLSKDSKSGGYIIIGKKLTKIISEI